MSVSILERERLLGGPVDHEKERRARRADRIRDHVKSRIPTLDGPNADLMKVVADDDAIEALILDAGLDQVEKWWALPPIDGEPDE